MADSGDRMPWPQRLKRYRAEGAAQVRGWLDDQVFDALLPAGQLQDAAGIAGAIYEIGVYEGRFLLALEQLRRPGEALVAIDLFALPGRTDGPRVAGPAALLANAQRFASDPAALVVLTADSAALDAAAVAALRDRHGPARLFSIDGDHAPERAQGDLAIAAALLAPGGLVFLDDCFNPLFPGVQEGLARYMLGAEPPALVPVAHYGNKLLLTDRAHHARYLAAFNRRLALDQVRRKLHGLPGYDARPARCWGHEILALRGPSGDGDGRPDP